MWMQQKPEAQWTAQQHSLHAAAQYACQCTAHSWYGCSLGRGHSQVARCSLQSLACDASSSSSLLLDSIALTCRVTPNQHDTKLQLNAISPVRSDTACVTATSTSVTLSRSHCLQYAQ